MAHLAIAGGEPIRRTPFPRWPFWNQEEVAAVQAVVRVAAGERNRVTKCVILRLSLRRIRKLRMALP